MSHSNIRHFMIRNNVHQEDDDVSCEQLLPAELGNADMHLRKNSIPLLSKNLSQFTGVSSVGYRSQSEYMSNNLYHNDKWTRVKHTSDVPHGTPSGFHNLITNTSLETGINQIQHFVYGSQISHQSFLVSVHLTG